MQTFTASCAKDEFWVMSLLRVAVSLVGSWREPIPGSVSTFCVPRSPHLENGNKNTFSSENIVNCG